MADNFNLRSFLTENKLTKNAKLLKEETSIDGRIVDMGSIEIDGVDMDDYPDFADAYIAYAEFEDGTPLSEDELMRLGEENYGLVNDLAHESLHEAKKKKPVMEVKQSPREKYLTRLVENALGINPHSSDDMESTTSNDDVYEKAFDVMPEGEEMVTEKPLPKYENIEKLMQEIEHGTNEAAYKHKMNKMKEVAEMLETRVAALEEGEGAEFVDTKKVKQMKKDIMTLRKQAEKLEKEYDKKFGEKKSKKQTQTENKQTMENTFDLKKFLTENRLTTTSKMLNENSDMGEKMQFFTDFMEQYAYGMPEADILEILQDSYDIPEDVDMQILEKATSQLDLAINDIYTAIFESDNY